MRSPTLPPFIGLLPLLLLWITPALALLISFPQTSVSVGASVNYTWSTSGQNKTDAALTFFAVKARLNGSAAHYGTYETVQIPDPHDSDHTGEVNMPFPPPLQDGIYVLDAIVPDPTNSKTGLLILASTNMFRIFNNNSNPSPSSTITNQSPSNTITALPRGHSRTAIIAGSVCGGVIFLLLLIGGCVLLARRRRRRITSSNSRSRPTSRWHRSSKWNPDNMVMNNDPKSDKIKADRRSELTIEPYDLPMKMAKEQEKAATPMTPTPTSRQMQLRNELTERVAQLEQAMQLQATTSAVENSRLRAEVQWLRDHQESDWARGLTNEIPPSYLDDQSRLPHS